MALPNRRTPSWQRGIERLRAQFRLHRLSFQSLLRLRKRGLKALFQGVHRLSIGRSLLRRQSAHVPRRLSDPPLPSQITDTPGVQSRRVRDLRQFRQGLLL